MHAFFSLYPDGPGFSSWQNFLVRFYRRNLPHLQRDFKPHFITFVTKSRWLLPENARDIVLSCCCHDHRQKYELYVAVVMPDHVHIILTPLINHNEQEIFSLIEIMRGIKGASARAINQLLSRHGPVWQEESFDHVLRSSEGLDSKIEYVLQNPVRTGLVNSWQEYRWAWQRADREPALMTVNAIADTTRRVAPDPLVREGFFCLSPAFCRKAARFALRGGPMGPPLREPLGFFVFF